MNADITIVGGGLVGLTLALALKDYSGQVIMIEAIEPKLQTQHEYDARSIVLAHGSRCFLEDLGVWNKIAAWATPVLNVHVSEQGRLSKTRLSAKKEQVPALGYVIEIPDLYNALLESVKTCKNLSRMCPAKVTDILHIENTKWQLSLDSNESITTDLVLAADGVNSSIRQALSVASQATDYKHTAIIANVTLAKPHQHMAFERFTKTGPLALLPLQANRAALIWTCPAGTEDELLALSEQAFIEVLENKLSYPGKITQVGKRTTYPLKNIWLNQQVHPQLVFMGNAAHTLHPVAGQGFNLSIQDIKTLTALLNNATKIDQALLERYQQQRKPRQKILMQITDLLARGFTANFSPIVIARNAALNLLDNAGLAKHWFTRYMMGL